jgi:hypothetical protein
MSYLPKESEESVVSWAGPKLPRRTPTAITGLEMSETQTVIVKHRRIAKAWNPSGARERGSLPEICLTTRFDLEPVSELLELI